MAQTRFDVEKDGSRDGRSRRQWPAQGVAFRAFGFKPEHLDEGLMYRAQSTLWLRSRQAWL